MKTFKAFTLVELIVAIAVFGILMTGIIQLVEPISETAASAKVINDQKNIENAICTYIGENMRLATNLYIVEGGTPQNAITKFLDAEPLDIYGNKITDPKKVEMICFDGTNQWTYSKYSPTYMGRIITKIQDETMAGSISKAGCSTDGFSGSYYMALGDAYYQQGDYFLKVEMSSSMMKLTTTSDFYLSENVKASNPNAFSSSSSNPVEGTYEILSYGSKPLNNSDNFKFKVIKENGTEITSGTVSTSKGPGGQKPIYFVYTTKDTFD